MKRPIYILLVSLVIALLSNYSDVLSLADYPILSDEFHQIADPTKDAAIDTDGSCEEIGQKVCGARFRLPQKNKAGSFGFTAFACRPGFQLGEPDLFFVTSVAVPRFVLPTEFSFQGSPRAPPFLRS